METFKKMLPDLIFNLVETIIIVLIGIFLNIPIQYIFLLIVVFLMSRNTFGNVIHFKTWYRCLVWSLLVMLTLLVLFKVDLVISVMFAIFSAFILTGKSNINDFYLWKSKDEPGKYQDIEEYVKYNEYSDKLIEFEDKIKKKSDIDYLIYKYRFKEHKTFNTIKELIDMENPRIDEHLERIALALRLYCGI